MSKRYGRNQKRAHRHRIAELEKALQASNVHAMQLREYLRHTESEIACAKEILGPYCVAFNPQRSDMRVSRQDYAEIHEHDRQFNTSAYRFIDPAVSFSSPVPTSRIRLPIMSVLAKKQGDAHKARQLDLYFEGRLYGVAIDPFAFQMAREPRAMIQKLGERIAVMLWNELKRDRAHNPFEDPSPRTFRPEFAFPGNVKISREAVDSLNNIKGE